MNNSTTLFLNHLSHFSHRAQCHRAGSGRARWTNPKLGRSGLTDQSPGTFNNIGQFERVLDGEIVLFCRKTAERSINQFQYLKSCIFLSLNIRTTASKISKVFWNVEKTIRLLLSSRSLLPWLLLRTSGPWL